MHYFSVAFPIALGPVEPLHIVVEQKWEQVLRNIARRLRASRYCSKGHVLDTDSYAMLVGELGAVAVASAPLAS